VTDGTNLHQKKKTFMKTHPSLLWIAAISTAFAACQPKNEANVSLLHQEQHKAPVTEEEVTEIQPDEQLNRAIDDFAKGEKSQCVIALNEAIATMKTLSSSVTGIHKERMDQAAVSLRDLASQVEAGKVNDLSAFNHVLGRVGRALAKYRLSVTETEFFEATPEASGATLELAINNLEKVITKHHRQLTGEEKQLLDDASSVATQLKQGTKVDEDDLKDALKTVDGEIEKWNKEFETR